MPILTMGKPFGPRPGSSAWLVPAALLNSGVVESMHQVNQLLTGTGFDVKAPDQFASKTGMVAFAKTCWVAPPNIICLSRLCV